jgi:hypothetical protein
MQTAPVIAARYVGIYPGRAEQVGLVRRAVSRHLTGCPAADDMTLIASEFAANAVLHSASRGQFFTVRAELHPDHARVEVEDLGGPWRASIPTTAHMAWISWKRSLARMAGASRPSPTAAGSSGRASTSCDK